MLLSRERLLVCWFKLWWSNGSRRIRFTRRKEISTCVTTLWHQKEKLFLLFFCDSSRSSLPQLLPFHSKWWQRWKMNFHENSSNVCSAWITFAYSQRERSLDLYVSAFVSFIWHSPHFFLSWWIWAGSWLVEARRRRKIANCVSFMEILEDTRARERESSPHNYSDICINLTSKRSWYDCSVPFNRKRTRDFMEI